MTERMDLFTTPILKASPPNADDLSRALLEVIAAHRKTHAGIDRSNLGGWHSDTDMANWGGDASRELANFAVNTVSPHMADVTKAGKRQFGWQVEMWANVNGPGHANQMHCHPASFWSGVYYPDPGGSEIEGNGGELLLEDPRYPMAYMMMPDLLLRDAHSEPMYSQVAIRPVAGRIVLFPSWLRHSVRPHGGDRERVSIALNLALVDVKAVPSEP